MININDLNCKTRFILSRIPFLPIKYKLRDYINGDISFWWSKIMPFFDREKSLFNFDIWGWDLRELRFLNKFLQPGMTFFDIGAYHGLYSIIAANKVHPNGKVFAFEPTPSDYWRLRLHIWINKINNIKVENIALCNKNGQSIYYVPTSGIKTIARLKPSLVDKGKLKKIKVETQTLDKFVKLINVSKIDLFKVDIEGAEIVFLEGAKATIDRYEPLMIVEAIDVVFKPWGYQSSDLLNYIKDEFSYIIYEFDEDGFLNIHEIQNEYPEKSNCNFLAVPEKKLSNIEHLIN